MKYRKKPVVIEAMQFSGKNANCIFEWAEASSNDPPVMSSSGEALFIETLEGTMRADINDWIICGVSGEFYPCKPDIFAATYEPVL